MVRKMHICEWNLSVCVCFNWGRVSASSSLWMCFPLVLCMSESVCACGRRERQREGEHCCSCDEHALWHVPEPGMLGKKGKKEKEGEREGEKKNPLHLPYFKLFSIPPPPTPSHPTPHPASVCICLSVSCTLASVPSSSEHVVLFCTFFFPTFSHSFASLSSKTFAYYITTECIPPQVCIFVINEFHKCLLYISASTLFSYFCIVF